MLDFLRKLRSKKIDFPVEPYVFTKKDAKKIYSLVLKGALHHSYGNEVGNLENEFAKYHHIKKAFATNSGTAALELALRVISIKPGDEVILPAYTLISTAQAVLAVGALPVFADIDDTFTISPNSIKSLISPRTRAIIPVHIFGNVCDMGTISSLAKKHHLFVIEDCCQAVGAEYKNKKVGTLGDVGCFSFSAKKAIHAGEGGMLISGNSKIAKKLEFIKHQVENLHKSSKTGIQTLVYMDSMTQMQAALARVILSQLDSLNAQRRNNYYLFKKKVGTNLPFKTYKILPEVKPSFSRLVFTVDFKKLGISRDIFLKKMQALGVPLKTFYPYPLYKFKLFRNHSDTVLKTKFPFNTNKYVKYQAVHQPFVEQFCRDQVGLSFSPLLTEKHINYFCAIFTKALKSPK